MQPDYTPYILRWLGEGNAFEIMYKGSERVIEGNQPDRALIHKINDIANSAFTAGVTDVKKQLDPIMIDLQDQHEKTVEDNKALVAEVLALKETAEEMKAQRAVLAAQVNQLTATATTKPAKATKTTK